MPPARLPDDLAQTIRGFQESRAILTAHRTRRVHGRGERRLRRASPPHKMDTDPRATEMLLNALAALGLLVETERHVS